MRQNVDARQKNILSRKIKETLQILSETQSFDSMFSSARAGKIALAKPDLQDEITKELLKVEKIPLPTEECRNILIGKTIEAFDVYYHEIKDKDKIISFVKGQSNNPRNATKSKAERFLKKLEKR